MKQVERPIAVGGPVRKVRSHVFPGARNDAHVRRAYEYTARIDGNEAVVTIANTGAGHNFPTELRQRSLESLVVVKDRDGKEVARSRRVFRDPYRRPYGLTLPTNKQIPSGESREHRVPLTVAGGTVDCELHFKLYFPIEDNHPDLARRLEVQRLVFDGIAASDQPVTSDPETDVATPEGIDPRLAGPADLGEMANPKIAPVEFKVPTGGTPADIAELIRLFNFQIPQANRAAVQALAKIGLPAVPALIEALGSWDNKTFNQAGQVLRKIGAPAVPAVRAAIRHEQLYVRLHARRQLEMLPVPTDKDALVAEVLAGLAMPNALDRRSSLDLLATLGAFAAAPRIRACLDDFDPDVVRSAAFALAALDSRESVSVIESALARQSYDETRIDLAFALARLGATSGMPILLAGLDHRDDLIRENCFEKFMMVTRQHLGYEAMAPREERLAAVARLQAWWAANGRPELLHKPYFPSQEHDDHALHTVMAIGGGAGIVPAAANEDKALQELVDMGQDAIPALIKGLKFPPGFAQKRASVLSVLSRIGDRSVAPFVAQALRDPVFGVAQWAAAALERVGDPECIPALRRFQARVAWAAAAGQLPKSIPGPDPLLATAARTRLLLGDELAKGDLVSLLWSADPAARQTAIAALAQQFGGDRGYRADAEAKDRLAAAARWLE
jgi:HEAT repeat protein